MKLAGSEPASAPTSNTPPAEPSNDGFGDETPQEQPQNNDKPFDDEPFDAGVEADEDSDPKKFIEQLTGKLGQSLRKYNEAQGQPDYELEKFAINSLLAACHTSEMDSNDQDDIIKKVKTAGNNDDSKDDNENGSDDSDSDNSSGNDDSGDFGGDDDSDGSDDLEGTEITEEKEEKIFLDKPKKNNMFQPGSNDILNLDNNLKESKKSSIFDKIKSKLHETFNQEEEMTEPVTEPMVKPNVPAPKTKPNTQPSIAPSRKNKPFLPMPEVQPDPKANN